MSPSQCRPTGLQCRKTVVFGGTPGTDGRSRLRRIAWTPSVVREAEIVALGSPKAVRIGWMTTLAFRHMSLGQPVGRPSTGPACTPRCDEWSFPRRYD